MNVTIQGTNWQVPLRSGEPFMGLPKFKVVNGEYENDSQVFYRITDANSKWCWRCAQFVPAEKFFWLAGADFYAEKITNGKNAPYCMSCESQRKTRHRYNEWVCA